MRLVEKNINADIVISPGYEHLRDFITTIPQKFTDAEGVLLFKGRNEVRRLRFSGVDMVVKKYKRNSMIKRLLSLFIADKAAKSFHNARELKKRGFDTPAPIAYIGTRKRKAKHAYYICAYTPHRPIAERLVDMTPYDSLMAVDFADFVALLHTKGVLHKDLNNTNVLYKQENNHYEFQLIDINRMRFYDNGLKMTERTCLENLSLFCEMTDMFRLVLKRYIENRGWTADLFDRGLSLKEKHDREYRRKKKWKKKLKRVFAKHD